MWLIVNLMIAFLVKYENSNDSISAGNFIAGVIISTLIGHILIMLVTKLLHILYINNIENAFSDTDQKVTLQKKKFFDDTQKTEKMPILNNEYATNSEKLETKLSNHRWEDTSMSSSQNPETARNILKNSSGPNRASEMSNRVAPMKIKPEEETYNRASSEYIGDVDTMTSESKKGNNVLNTFVFLIMCGFVAFLVFFC